MLLIKSAIIIEFKLFFVYWSCVFCKIVIFNLTEVNAPNKRSGFFASSSSYNMKLCNLNSVVSEQCEEGKWGILVWALEDGWSSSTSHIEVLQVSPQVCGFLFLCLFLTHTHTTLSHP